MNNERVLVIDDEPDIREVLSLTLSHFPLKCDLAAGYQEGLELINRHEYCLVLTDMRLPDGSGYDIVRYIQRHKPHIPVAVITAFGNVEGAVNTLKAGAFDYVSKPIDVSVLKALVNTALRLNQVSFGFKNAGLVGESPNMVLLKENINKMARSQAPVFIYGESGVGKELVARLIHANGARAGKPFIPVNCGAISTELMESEFFGHVKGSFTGALMNKEGLFLAAQGGTLFLDEIAELPLAMQVKLLRAIQERAVKPVGAEKEIQIDVRILSASNKNLKDEIKVSRFRQELYYRINVIELQVPSLRERKSDLPLLVEAILKKLANRQQQDAPTMTKAAWQALESYDFPGNVRELENILERAIALCNNEWIDVSDLQLPRGDTSVSSVQRVIDGGLEEVLQQHEKDIILNALETTKWNRTAAAKLLGVSFRVLRYRLKKLGLD